MSGSQLKVRCTDLRYVELSYVARVVVEGQAVNKQTMREGALCHNSGENCNRRKFWNLSKGANCRSGTERANSTLMYLHFTHVEVLLTCDKPYSSLPKSADLLMDASALNAGPSSTTVSYAKG
jgi:hypothetical protein